MHHVLRLLIAPALLILSACVAPTPLVGPLPPPPPGTARIILYRDIGYYDPSDVLTVSFNDQSTATVARGDVVYRDVAPGAYTITFRPTAYAVNQFKTVTVAAGDVAYVKFQAYSQDSCGGIGGISGNCRGIAYTSVVIDPALGQQEIRGLNRSQG